MWYIHTTCKVICIDTSCIWCIFFQTKFSEVHKELLAVQSEFEAMKSKLTGLEFQLSESQQISQGQDDTIKSQAKRLREQQDALTSLRSSEEGLRSLGQEMEETVTSLKKELARSQAEYSLLREVIQSFLIWMILNNTRILCNSKVWVTVGGQAEYNLLSWVHIVHSFLIFMIL